MTEPTEHRSPLAPGSGSPRRSRWDTIHPGRLVLGLVLAAFGVVWLLEALDVVDVDADVVLPVGLIVIGVALVVAGASGRAGGGLVGLGVVLTIVLIVTTVVEIPFTGGVGDRTERPQAFVGQTHELAVGKLTLDLSALSYEDGVDPSEATVEARVGIGQLVVIAPQSASIACLSVDATSGIGQVTVFGVERDGIDAAYATDTACTAEPRLLVDVSVGMGQVDVTHG